VARFDVYANPVTEERKLVPFVLDVQNTFLTMESRVVIPLLMSSALSHKVRDLNPEFTVAGKTVVLHSTAIAAIDATALRSPVTNLSAHQTEIQQSLDTLFGGY
jgi:toxin CcdB